MTSLSSGGSAAELLDPVTRYLHRLDHPTTIAYLGETEFELGRQVVLGELELVYRFESGSLLLCHVGARGGMAGSGNAIRRLIVLVHAIDDSVPEVLEVSGLVPVQGESAEESGFYARLREIYLRQGAEFEPIDDDDDSMLRMVLRTRAGGRVATGIH